EAGHQDAPARPDDRRGHGAVPLQEPARGPHGARSGRHRPEGGQLHRLHALRPQLPGLVHLHRGPQDEGPAPPPRRQGADGQRARPLRHRLLAVHVLRHLRRGLPLRRPLLEPGVRVLRAPPRRPPARQGPPRRVDGDRARLRALRGRVDGQGPEGPPLMVAQNIFFYLFAAVMVFSAVRVVTAKSIVHAALYLVAVLAGAAAQYILLAAEFVAATQVLVYIGAVMVLFLFGIMLTRVQIGRDADLTNRHWGAGIVTALVLFGVMAYALLDAFGWTRTPLPKDTRIMDVAGSNSATVSDAIF